MFVFAVACTSPRMVDDALPPELVVQSEGELYVRIFEPPSPPFHTWLVVHGGPGLTHDHMLPLQGLRDRGDRVVFYDQRGSGQSGEATGWRFGAHVRDIDAILDAVGVGSVRLAGSSWGGLLAQIYAARRPERVDELVLIGSAPATYGALIDASLRFDARVVELQAAGVIESPLPTEFPAYLAAVLPAYFGERRAVPEEATVPLNEPVYRAISDANLFVGYDHRAELVDIEAPVRVLVGEVDPFGVEMSETVAADLAFAASVDVIEGCGHWPWFYCAAATFDAMTR